MGFLGPVNPSDIITFSLKALYGLPATRRSRGNQRISWRIPERTTRRRGGHLNTAPTQNIQFRLETRVINIRKSLAQGSTFLHSRFLLPSIEVTRSLQVDRGAGRTGSSRHLILAVLAVKWQTPLRWRALTNPTVQVRRLAVNQSPGIQSLTNKARM